MTPGAPATAARAALQERIGRGALVTAGVGCALAALLVVATVPAGAPARLTSAGTLAALSLLAAAGSRAPARWLRAAVHGVLLCVLLAFAATAVALGYGLAAPGLAVYGLVVCVGCVFTGWRSAALLAGAAAAALLAVASSTPLQAAIPGGPGTALLLGTHSIAIAAGLACGVLISSLIARTLDAADDREQRFRGLLALATDAYWEIDHRYRLVAVRMRRDQADQSTDPDALDTGTGIGRVPWELERFACDFETLDSLQADLDARRPFRDVPVDWRARRSGTRLLRISGEPRFGPRGVFTGYWGVARDVTDHAAAREALAATESLYQELFSRIPTPLVLHRGGRVIDANPAGCSLFGHDDPATMLRSDLLASYESGDSRERERRRIETLQADAPGAGVPVADFRLLVRGRLLSVRATGVQVSAADGPATLSIYVDDTERRSAEDAVRRSEALLSHLVAVSPDLITLTDLATGRYAMVNHAFERLIGHSAAETVGRTALELGVWREADERLRFVEAVQANGQVKDLPTTFNSKRGDPVSMLVSAARFMMDRRDYMVVNARDVTESERVRLEREAILENASLGIAVTRDGVIVLANPAFEQMFGWPPGELLGQPGSTVWRSDADQAEIRRRLGPQLARGDAVETEGDARRRDGSSFRMRIIGRAIDPRRPTDGGTVWIVEDVTERRAFEHALAAARDAAEAANRAKSTFLANTSHELRTPLNGMIGLAELARATDLAEPRRQQYLDQIADSARALATIISDILDLSKIEAGKLELERTAFDLGGLLRTLHRSHASVADGRGLTLELTVDAGADGVVWGDPLRLRQVVGNFLSNALKFTDHGGVRVGATRTGLQVRIEVRDSGPGIEAATQARLFRPFTQADESTTRRFGGTGLGLSICRELALLMGGDVGVESRAGDGSTFWAELPLPEAPVQADAAEAGAATAGADSDGGRLHGARVLMVEDNPVNMLIGVAFLERWGVQVEQALDGGQALQAVELAARAGRPFDAVLMDVQMPVMSGHETTRALRVTAAGRAVPIIALTAAALVTEREEALQAGMNDFLTKPIDPERLRTTLARWLPRTTLH